MSSELLFLPMLAHIALSVLLYALLTVVRAPSVWNIRSLQKSVSEFERVESRISANLSNQFEWPLLFYAITVLLMATQSTIHSAFVTLAWLFVIGRIMHSIVQIGSTNIRLRGIVFTINYVMVLAMWGLYYVKYIA